MCPSELTLIICGIAATRHCQELTPWVLMSVAAVPSKESALRRLPHHSACIRANPNIYQSSQDEANPPMPGAKPLGAHDHGGIGFSKNSPAPPAPSSNVYQLGQA